MLLAVMMDGHCSALDTIAVTVKGGDSKIAQKERFFCWKGILEKPNATSGF